VPPLQLLLQEVQSLPHARCDGPQGQTEVPNQFGRRQSVEVGVVQQDPLLVAKQIQRRRNSPTVLFRGRMHFPDPDAHRTVCGEEEDLRRVSHAPAGHDDRV